jgi:hypothetical protein
MQQGGDRFGTGRIFAVAVGICKKCIESNLTQSASVASSCWVAPPAVPAVGGPRQRSSRQRLPCSCWVAPAPAGLSPELGGPAGDFSPPAAGPWHEPRLSPSTTSRRWVAPASGSLVSVGWPPRLPVFRLSWVAPAGDFSPSAARPWHESRLSPSTTSRWWVAPASGSLVRVGWPQRLPQMAVRHAFPRATLRAGQGSDRVFRYGSVAPAAA